MNVLLMRRPLVKTILLTLVLITGILFATAVSAIWRRPELGCWWSANRPACYQRLALNALERSGTRAAQRFAGELFSRQTIDHNGCHDIVHALGRAAFKQTQDIQQTLDEAELLCASGFSHGAMEGFFGGISVHGVIAPEHVASACRAYADKKNRLAGNCFHGLGHGLGEEGKRDIHTALAHCDLPKDQWQRDNCYDGLFMAVAESSHQAISCGELAQRYRLHCYWRYLPADEFTSGPKPTPEDMAALGRTVPKDYQRVFWYGTGRYLNKAVSGDIPAMEAFCSRLPEEAIADCLGGAALYQVTIHSGASDRAGSFCAALADENRQRMCRKSARAENYPRDLP